MNHKTIFAGVLSIDFILISLVWLKPPDQPTERGEYLVHHVAMCVQCHTPRDQQGNLIEQELLEGAPMPVKSPFPNMPWGFNTPTLAGLGGFAREDIISLLRTGSRPNTPSPRPPMPPFRMSQKDAEAVVAYLESLSK